MAGKQQIEPDKLRMDEGEFDRIMRKALQVNAPPKKTKKSAKRQNLKAGKRRV